MVFSGTGLARAPSFSVPRSFAAKLNVTLLESRHVNAKIVIDFVALKDSSPMLYQRMTSQQIKNKQTVKSDLSLADSYEGIKNIKRFKKLSKVIHLFKRTSLP